MSGHTPGPWVSLYPEVFQVDAPEARTRIASLPHSVSNQQEANASLIAVSPDFLELAKAWEAWEAKLILEAKANALEFMSTELYDEMLALQTQRNEAIAKAEGR